MWLVQKMRKTCASHWVPNMFCSTPFRRLHSAPTLLPSPTALKHVFCLQTGNDFWKDQQTSSTKIILLISAPLWRYHWSDAVCHLSNIFSTYSKTREYPVLRTAVPQLLQIIGALVGSLSLISPISNQEIKIMDRLGFLYCSKAPFTLKHTPVEMTIPLLAYVLHHSHFQFASRGLFPCTIVTCMKWQVGPPSTPGDFLTGFYLSIRLTRETLQHLSKLLRDINPQ